MNTELLLPAGDFQRLKFAFLYGADAVYLGGRDFSLRANNKNFSVFEIKKAVEYAHKLNKKVYVTLNIVFHNSDLKKLKKYLISLYNINVDAVIISDLFLLDYIKEVVPNLEIHLSTQQSVLNYESAKFFKNENVERIVLGRELNKKEIQEIIKKSKIDIEVFIHGAMCVSYSGRCVLSNYYTNRDSNRGGCSQVCRWNFDLFDNDKKINTNDFKIALKDLSMAKYIKDLIDINVKSLKVEGRMRSVYYVATVAYIYRKIIDNEFNEDYEYELYRCANREAVSHYFNKKVDENEQYYNDREEPSNKDFLGLVLEYKNNEIILEQRNYFKKGDYITIFGPKTDKFSFKVEYIKDIENNVIDVGRHPKQILKIPCNKRVYKDDIIRVKFDIDIL